MPLKDNIQRLVKRDFFFPRTVKPRHHTQARKNTRLLVWNSPSSLKFVRLNFLSRKRGRLDSGLSVSAVFISFQSEVGGGTWAHETAGNQAQNRAARNLLFVIRTNVLIFFLFAQEATLSLS